MRALVQDLRVAARGLRKNPGFTAAVLVTLGLGIGGATTVYSVIDGVLLAPLPYREPDRLVRLYSSNAERGWYRFDVSPQDAEDWRRAATGLTDVGVYQYDSANLSGAGQARRVEVVRVSPSVFTLLGTPPLLGRTFSSAESRPGALDAVVLAYRFWKDALGADPSIVGADVRLDGHPFHVAGVMPPSFWFPVAEVDLWRPLSGNPADLGERGERFLGAIGRLAPGVSREQAGARLDAVAKDLAREHPDADGGWTVTVVPFQEWAVGEAVQPLVVLASAVGLMLLLACVNVANLLLARATGRVREVATRVALGAGLARLVRQVLAESLLLGVAGGALGVLVAAAATRLLPVLAGGSLPRLDAVGVNGSVLLFALGVSLATGLAFGLAPVAQALAADLVAALKDGSRASDGRGALRWQRAMVVAQIAFALVLVAGAGLLIESFRSVVAIDPGFQPEGVLTARVAPPRVLPPGPVDLEAYEASRQGASRFYGRLVERIEALPEVRSAGAINRLPVSGNWWYTSLYADDRPRPPAGQVPSVYGRVVTPGYFRTLGIPILEGRSLSSRDRSGGEPVAVINRAAARAFWPDGDPLGVRIALDDPASQHTIWYTVVGVVGDVHLESLEADASPAVYVPFGQALFGFPSDWAMSLVVRTSGRPETLIPAISEAVRELAPTLPLFQVRTLDELLGDSLDARRLTLVLLATFAAIGLVLAAVGTYGVMAYLVSRRTHSLGVRMALGAGRGDILRLVLRQGVLLAGAGIAIGLPGSLAGSRLVASLLFRVSPWDPGTFAAVVALLVAVAAAASYLPARRAAAVDPGRALRGE